MEAAFKSVGRTFGSYQILEGLALGGMSEIYLARVHTEEDVAKYAAVKLLQPRLAQDPSFVDMFMNEARLSASLQHPNIGRVYDIGQQDELPYYAMEYLHGYDARSLMEKLRARGRRMVLDLGLTIVEGIANGLHYAHEKRGTNGQPMRLVHRDVSPSNIFLTYAGGIKLVDFGLAVVGDMQSAKPGHTIKGKSAYLSPEQCNNQPLDRRSDVFSLGVVLYELTTGTRLFRRGQSDDNYTVMNRIVKGEIPRPSSVVADYPQTLEDVVLQALAIEPDKRHPNAKALALDVQAVARTEGLNLSIVALAGYLEKTLGAKNRTLESSLQRLQPSWPKYQRSRQRHRRRVRRRADRRRVWRRSGHDSIYRQSRRHKGCVDRRGSGTG